VFDDPPPFRTHALAVAHGHVLHVQESGRPDGLPALVLHGGPGSGCSPLLRRFFDPARYRIVCVDQRGAGRSTPRGDIAHNTTSLLLGDLQALRRHLGITRWLVVGGSWGATLALAYALRDPDAVEALLLRALFLARREDIEAFFRGSNVAWPRLTTASEDEARTIALDWWRHESALSGSSPSAPDADALLARYRIQSHYLQHGCWLNDPPLLQRCEALPRVPTLLLHGRDDRICAPEAAQALHAVAPHATLRWIEGAGHDPTHPAMVAAMVDALDTYACQRSFTQDAPAPPTGALRSLPGRDLRPPLRTIGRC
jgi:proline iminopeptidase